MRLSIVIPVYNVADYLPKCLESVLSQDTEDCEMILVDDGSTDGKSGELCDAFEGQYPGLIRVIHKSNGGLGDARNVGAERARGDWLFFLDSDDYISCDTLETLKAATDPGAPASAADAIVFGYSTVRDGQVTGEVLDDLPTDRVFTLSDVPSLLLATPNACNKLWRREFLLSSGIKYPSRVWYEDIRTTTKLYAKASGVFFIPKAFYHYVYREGSITKNTNVARNREILSAFDDVLSFFDSEGYSELFKKELEALTAFHVYLTASVRVARIDPRSELIPEFAAYTEERFPDFRKNGYIKTWGRAKRLAFSLLNMKAYRLLALLFRLFR